MHYREQRFADVIYLARVDCHKENCEHPPAVRVVERLSGRLDVLSESPLSRHFEVFRSGLGGSLC